MHGSSWEGEWALCRLHNKSEAACACLDCGMLARTRHAAVGQLGAPQAGAGGLPCMGGKEVFGPMLQCHANRHGPGSATALQSPVHSTCTPRFGHKAPLHVRLTAHQSVSKSG